MADQTRGRVPILAGAAEANVKETHRGLRVLPRARRAGRRDRLAVLLQAQPGGGVRLLQRDRPTTRRSTSRSTTFRCSPRRSTCRRCSGLAEECPKIVAIKDSSGDLPHMMRMIAAVRPIRPDFSFLTGWDAALMPMLLDRLRRRHERHQRRRAGSHAQALRPDASAGKLDEARDLQYKLLTLFDAMLYSADFPEGFRAAVGLRGFKHGRRPAAAGAAATRTTRDAAQYAAMPAGRKRLRRRTGRRLPAARRHRRTNPDEVGRIVQGVIAELKRRGIA